MHGKGTVLVVDDSSAAREGLRALLEVEGYSVVEAKDGKEATSYLESNTPPVMVLLDLIMPVCDGWSFLEWRSGHSQARQVPVIVLSGASRAADTVPLIQGARNVRVLLKPVNPTELLTLVGRERPQVEATPPEVAPPAELSGALRELVETIQDYGVHFLDPQGLVTSWSAGAERLTGYTAAEVVGKHFSTFVTPEERLAGNHEEALGIVAARERYGGEGWRVRKDGSRFWAHVVVTTLRGAEREVKGFGVVVGDITKRKRAEEDFQRFFELSHDMLTTVGFDGTFKRVNSAWTKCLGYAPAELVGRPYIELVHEDDRERTSAEAARAEEGSATIAFENRYRAKDGAYRNLQWNATPLPEQQVIYAVARDVTESRRLEEQLRQSQKLEAIGRLAGGVAHDFNNVLTAVQGYSELILERLPKEHPLRGHVEQIRKAGARAASLTHQLLAFSRKQILQPKVLSVNDVITNLVPMVQRLIPENIAIEPRLGADAGNVKVDSGQLDQVLLNLALNARDAMPAGGTLTIETRAVEFDEDFVRFHVGSKVGPYSLITFTDTGQGMPKETVDHVFEPFFTTKGDRGTGLGLATVYGIVKQSGGNIWVYSEVGRGTTFKVYLPRVEEAVAETRTPVRTAPKGRGELVLLAEDEVAIRTLVTGFLTEHGYDVAVIETPEDALRAVAARGRPPELLVTDVIMPVMGGRELADRLKAKFLGMKVIFMSGYTDNAIVTRGVIEPGTVFVQKPFSPQELLEKVRGILDAQG